MKKLIIVLVLALIALMPTVKGQIFFASGDATLGSVRPIVQDLDMLDRIVDHLKSDSTIKVQLIGYADPAGSVTANFQLGLDRCETVSSYLQSAISADRIHIISMGEEHDHSRGWAFSRRVEIHWYRESFGSIDADVDALRGDFLEIEPATGETDFEIETSLKETGASQSPFSTVASSTELVDTVLISRVDTVIMTVVDTVIETVSSSPCGCENLSAAQKWDRYMSLRKEIAKERDPFKKDILVACRLAIGREVRSAHRENGRLLAKGDVPKPTKVSNSRGGRSGLARARAKNGWRKFVNFFKSIGACRKA